MVIGFNMTFIIQHFLGLAGMPRRVYTYADLPGWAWMNMVSTIGAFFMAAASLIFVWNLIVSLLHGRKAGDNPWHAWTLEWATTSPPPHENFHYLPPIRSRRPLWDVANPDRPDPVVGSRGEIDQFKPEKNKTSIVAFIISETGFFAGADPGLSLLQRHPASPGRTRSELDLLKTGLFSLCLFASSFTIWRAETGLRNNNQGRMIGWLSATIILGGIFIGGQGIEYWHLFQSGVDGEFESFRDDLFYPDWLSRPARLRRPDRAPRPAGLGAGAATRRSGPGRGSMRSGFTGTSSMWSGFLF